MEGPVSWQALILLASLMAATTLFTGWLVFRLCQIVGALERRLQRLEMLFERRRGAPGAP
jgi:hypothetical protein